MAAGAPRMVIATLAAHEGVSAVCERGCGALGDIALRVATRGGSPAWLRARPARRARHPHTRAWRKEACKRGFADQRWPTLRQATPPDGRAAGGGNCVHQPRGRGRVRERLQGAGHNCGQQTLGGAALTIHAGVDSRMRGGLLGAERLRVVWGTAQPSRLGRGSASGGGAAPLCARKGARCVELAVEPLGEAEEQGEAVGATAVGRARAVSHRRRAAARRRGRVRARARRRRRACRCR